MGASFSGLVCRGRIKNLFIYRGGILLVRGCVVYG